MSTRLEGCPFDDRDETAVRYVRDALTSGERESFELHLLSCANCQAAVREAVELHAAFRARRGSRRAALFAGGLAAAAVVSLIWLMPSGAERLGRVDHAPVIQTMSVRSSTDSAAVWAELGTAAYNRGEYDTAALLLQRAHTQDQQPGTAFVLGAALLLDGRPDSALSAFRQVSSASRNAYVAEALYFSAKAWLQLGAPDSATVVLTRAVEIGTTEQRVHARALLDSVSRVR